jgi:ATP-dependent DNA helicase RecG
MGKQASKEFDARRFMEMSIEEMKKSKNEPRPDGKVPPKVGAVLVFPDGEVVAAYRGELREGDHAEFTLIERKLADRNLEEYILFTTLEPCVERNAPKVPCCRRTTNARIKMVYVGITDPDPTVDGKGIQHLFDGNVTVKMFDRDLQNVITQENQMFISQAMDRKKKVEEADLLGPLERLVPEADLTQLSEKALTKFIKESKLDFVSVEDPDFLVFLSDLRLIQHDPEDKAYRPTGLGILLFGKHPRARYPQSALMASVEYGANKIEPRTFDEALVLLPDAISDWLQKVLPLSKEISGFKRRDVPEIPLDVLREAVINAVVHRDYMIEGAKCSVEIDDSKIVVRSPGQPLPYITLEQLNSFEAPSISRNPVISYIFGLMDYVEEKGFGMKAFRALHEKNGVAAPEYAMQGPFLTMTFTRNTEILRKVIHDHALSQLKPSELAMVDYVREKGQATRQECQEALGIEKRKALRQLDKLEELGILRRQGAGPSTYYELSNP